MKTLLMHPMILVALIVGLAATAPAREPAPPQQDLQKAFPTKPPYSPYADRHFPERVCASPLRLLSQLLVKPSARVEVTSRAFGRNCLQFSDVHNLANGPYES